MTRSLLFTFAESKVRLELGDDRLGEIGLVVGTLLDADHTGVLLAETGRFAFYPWSAIHRVEILDAKVKER